MNNLIHKPIVFSGVQPTGNIHLGNYLGTIKNWVNLQTDNKCLFCVVDLHSITSNFCSRNSILEDTINVAISYMACGIDVSKSLVFTQSSVPAHSELCWLLGCLTSLGWLNRMTQFKDKSQANKSSSSLGLYSYPVLMAADILLYKANLVPVGDDQKQHLELSQQIAATFNNHFKTHYFPIPQPLILEKSSRIMSLRDGIKKMSKSNLSDYSRINLNDSDDIITKKIKKATTDNILGFEFDGIAQRPEIYNLLNIYATLTNQTIEETCILLQGYDMKHFKKQLADLLIAHISPIRKKSQELLKNKDYVIKIIHEGNQKAQEMSCFTIKEIKKIIGFLV